MPSLPNMIGPLISRLLGRKRTEPPSGRAPAPQSAALARNAVQMEENCTRCGACVRECAFLKRHGAPAEWAARWNAAPHRGASFAYQCSQCGLCAAVCPEGLDPGRLLLEMRRQEAANGRFNPSPYRSLLLYETLGASALFSCYALEKGCDTVLFPGCALPGTRPGVLQSLFAHLRRQIPNLGMVLACCGKPSHDLGRTDRFHSIFDPILHRLHQAGIRTVLTACPNCTAMFRTHGREFTVRTIYEELCGQPAITADVPGLNPLVTVHDPCPLRLDQASQEAVRNLLTARGYRCEEMKHQRRRTLCCGEGGAVGHMDPELARTWSSRRAVEAQGRLLVTSCAGCVGLLGRLTSAVHLLDLLFAPDTSTQKQRVARPPFTYFNRLLLKWRISAWPGHGRRPGG